MKDECRLPIRLKFRHWRNISDGDQFKPWIKSCLPSARFVDFEIGYHYPTIAVSYKDFVDATEKIPTKDLVGIEGDFTTLECLSLGVNSFKHDLRDIISHDPELTPIEIYRDQFQGVSFYLLTNSDKKIAIRDIIEADHGDLDWTTEEIANKAIYEYKVNIDTYFDFIVNDHGKYKYCKPRKQHY